MSNSGVGGCRVGAGKCTEKVALKFLLEAFFALFVRLGLEGLVQDETGSVHGKPPLELDEKCGQYQIYGATMCGM